ncbi:hypothetical protein, partial [Rheinheimera tangshanensis]|uniref:hypothetical protein n=1 Tax=Rheinheimera tangshanensis TaxID=400153 RepID=UPI0016280B33
ALGQGARPDPKGSTQTNNIEPLPEGVKIHQDHIYPKNAIEKLDGFDMLTPAQQRLLLNDPENLQPLPASLNCSKGCTIEGTEKSWNPSEKVAPDGLDPNHREWLKSEQESNRARLQKKINDMMYRNGGG